ncbi:MAG: acyltransferase family protein [Lachnospiraceae bacterium]
MLTKRNDILELWRFIFCIMVLGLHFSDAIKIELFNAGYLGVEFFFLVSGYFIGSFYSKQIANKTIPNRIKAIGTYICSRLKRLYPLYLVALFFMLFMRSIINNYRFGDILTLAKSCFAEFILLQWTPIGNTVLISTDWYVPAIFWGGIFFIILLTITGKIGGFILAPTISFLIYRYYFILIGKIDVIASYYGVLRGIAGLGLGIFIYFLCQAIKDFPSHMSKLLFPVPNIILLCICIYSQFGHRSKWDFFIISLYAVCLFILMKAEAPVLNEKIKSVFGLLGKITYPVYLFQMPVIELFLTLFHLV